MEGYLGNGARRDGGFGSWFTRGEKSFSSHVAYQVENQPGRAGDQNKDSCGFKEAKIELGAEDDKTESY